MTTVSSSNGEFTIDPTGAVQSFKPWGKLDRGAFNPARIFQFDLREWRAFYSQAVGEYLSSRGAWGFDILDLGYFYWYETSGRIWKTLDCFGYEPPGHQWRAEMGHAAQAGNPNDSTSYKKQLKAWRTTPRLQRALRCRLGDTTKLRDLSPGAIAKLSREISLYGSLERKHGLTGPIILRNYKGAHVRCVDDADVGEIREFLPREVRKP